MALKIFRSRAEILNAIRLTYPQTTLNLLALYDSRLDAIITDNLLIRIPITDQLNEG